MILKLQHPTVAQLYSVAFGYPAAKAETHLKIRKLKSSGKYSEQYIQQEEARLKQAVSSSRLYALNKIEELKQAFADDILTGDIRSQKTIDTRLRDRLAAPINYRKEEYLCLMRMYPGDNNSLNRRMIAERAALAGYQFTGYNDPEAIVSRFNSLCDAAAEAIRHDDIFDAQTDFVPEALNDFFESIDHALSDPIDPDTIAIVPLHDIDATIAAERQAEIIKAEKATAGQFEDGFTVEGEGKTDSGFLKDTADAMEILGIDSAGIIPALEIQLDADSLSAEKADPYILRTVSDDFRERGDEGTANALLRTANALLNVSTVEFPADSKERFTKISTSTAGDRAKIEVTRTERAREK